MKRNHILIETDSDTEFLYMAGMLDNLSRFPLSDEDFGLTHLTLALIDFEGNEKYLMQTSEGIPHGILTVDEHGDIDDIVERDGFDETHCASSSSKSDNDVEATSRELNTPKRNPLV